MQGTEFNQESRWDLCKRKRIGEGKGEGGMDGRRERETRKKRKK